MNTEFVNGEIVLIRSVRGRAQQRKFFLVWCSTGATPPKIRYCRRSAAERAAQRMSQRNPGKRFYVLESVIRYVESAGESLRQAWR